MDNEDRRRLVVAQETDDFKIVSFDSLAEGVEWKNEVSIGSRHNQFIDLHTDEVIDPGLFAWMEPTQIRVSYQLHQRLKDGPPSNHYVAGDNGEEEALSRAAKRVKIRSC